MHGEIDVAAQQRLLDLLGEQALAALLRQRPVLDGVAGGLMTLSSIVSGSRAVRRCKPLAHGARLPSASGLPRVPMRNAVPDCAMRPRNVTSTGN